jgi:hypothetical protein
MQSTFAFFCFSRGRRQKEQPRGEGVVDCSDVCADAFADVYLSCARVLPH